MYIAFHLSLQDQFGRTKVPEWQRIAGKAAKEVEKFAKEKADLVLMHWRDKMGIAQKEVSQVHSKKRGKKTQPFLNPQKGWESEFMENSLVTYPNYSRRHLY